MASSMVPNSTDEALGRREIKIKVIDETTTDVDQFMTEGSEERPWQVFELTQAQDVRDWIAAPKQIKMLQPTLHDLKNRLSGMARPLRILDVGCYGGYVYDYLDQFVFESREDFAYFGVDIQENAIKSAQIMHAECENATFQAGDIYKLMDTFGPDVFDVVVCYRVIIHIPFFEKCIENLCGVSKSLVHTALLVDETQYCKRSKETDKNSGKEVTYHHRWVTPNDIYTAAVTSGVLDHSILRGDDPKKTYTTVAFSKTRSNPRD